jgi:pimeloyl-ACP methyl ester carboxylesterase
MLHGLASSPEAWINVANEVLGDERLRQHYQIWQVYYPTNAPLAFNHHSIRTAITRTRQHFDPTASAPASRDMVVIGHSMGGVLARLLVSDAGDQLWNTLLGQFPRADKARKKIGPYLDFEPMPGINRAIFIAAPHRGSPFAEYRLARWLSGLITVPTGVVKRLTDIAQLLVDPDSANAAALTRPLNSIDNLSSSDPFITATATLPIGSGVRYHSIIANNTPDRALSDSDDGLVPYTSAHLAGADSEKILDWGHSVQENPQAIIEIRRILHTHLYPSGATAAASLSAAP